ncbi:recombinase family protein [Sinirhodobacter sp. WL0062]|uniref:Recombinase family protein n=1 Tax=Rhodobacter flavimaris TaxID=2907145 RepID=A0ABS8YRC8_9RHOB|nr:recombinase family protein [Sinirhodobacter sp. WL0062]MCE5972434.1 recombinase family protein [Sinirhodobacter sp. WL0062]
MRNAVGFYWTLPVPWAGFTELPKDIDEAAKASRTIRYQRELIRRYAKEHNLRLVAEEAFLEIKPDRGSEYVLDALRSAEKICREKNAQLLYVGFSEVHGWRGHGPLEAWVGRAGIDVDELYPDEIEVDGAKFDPHAHFGIWRKRQYEWSAKKQERVSLAKEEALKLRETGETYRDIAFRLNEANIRSATGKLWTEDMVRHLLHQAET